LNPVYDQSSYPGRKTDQRRTHKANVQSPKKSDGVPSPSQLKCCGPAIPSGA
jgi:hypothetical protein